MRCSIESGGSGEDTSSPSLVPWGGATKYHQPGALKQGELMASQPVDRKS